jgi:hypothetical protein
MATQHNRTKDCDLNPPRCCRTWLLVLRQVPEASWDKLTAKFVVCVLLMSWQSVGCNCHQHVQADSSKLPHKHTADRDLIPPRCCRT